MVRGAGVGVAVTMAAGLAVLDVGIGRRQHDLAQLGDRFGELFGGGFQGFGETFHRAQIIGLQRGFGADLRQRGQHDHRNGLGGHQLFQKLDPAHPRHFHVEGDDIGFQLGDLFARLRGAIGGSHHLNAAHLFQDIRKQRTHGRRIIHHQHSCIVHRDLTLLL